MLKLSSKTEFEEALYLIGAYQQDFHKTGIFDYSVDWNQKTTPQEARPRPNSPIDTAEKQKSTPHRSTNPTPPDTKEPSDISLTDITVGPIFINPPPEEPDLPPSAPNHQGRLTELDAESRLFWLYVQDVEATGQLSKLPPCIHKHL